MSLIQSGEALKTKLALSQTCQVIIPPDGYLKSVRDLCSKYNILMIADEIQSGMERSGRMMACEWEKVWSAVVVKRCCSFRYQEGLSQVILYQQKNVLYFRLNQNFFMMCTWMILAL